MADWDLSAPFFSGIGGSGMSALAQYLAMQGGAVCGSDRSLDQGTSPIRPYLEKLGIELCAQDGSGPRKDHTCLVVSTAIEGDHPELEAAKNLGLPVVHRSQVLAQLTRRKKSVAVSGTSGKSTVTAMLFTILEEAGWKPGVLCGANLPALREKGLWGNAFYGQGDWLVFEADESDGTLVNYQPEVGLALNLDRDHKEIHELLPLFQTFFNQIKNALVLHGEDPQFKALQLPGIPVARFSASGIRINGDSYPLNDIKEDPMSSSFVLASQNFKLPVPGAYNRSNALAAIAGGLSLGLSLEACAQGLEHYAGLERRFNLVSQKNGIAVVDDFAHNPAKIEACLTAARRLIAVPEPETIDPDARSSKTPQLPGDSSATCNGGKLIAVFHPHGFGPLKMLQEDLAESFRKVLSPEDHLLVTEAYYAGGTADKEVTAAHLVNQVKSGLLEGPHAVFVPNRREIPRSVKAIAQPGDVVVQMGARDPQLGKLARQIAATLGEG